jgi:hypothetical protein
MAGAELEAERLRSAVLQDSINGCAQRVAALKLERDTAEQRGYREGLREAAEIVDAEGNRTQGEDWKSMGEMQQGVLRCCRLLAQALRQRATEQAQDAQSLNGLPNKPAGDPAHSVSPPTEPRRSEAGDQ